MLVRGKDMYQRKQNSFHVELHVVVKHHSQVLEIVDSGSLKELYVLLITKPSFRLL